MTAPSAQRDYTGVTETPGTQISRQAASMALSRYELVRRRSRGKAVLEIACGSGQGLGYVAASATRLVGGDVTFSLLARANRHYAGAPRPIPLVQFDAHALPFAPKSFDLIQIHEAIYYFADIDRVLAECARVLRDDGTLMVSSINSEWPDFNPSPHAVHYCSAAELGRRLSARFRTVDISFGFAVEEMSSLDAVKSAIKRIAVRLNLIPKTMKGKTLLKRVFLGPLVTVPHELQAALAPVEQPIQRPLTDAPKFRVIYAVAEGPV